MIPFRPSLKALCNSLNFKHKDFLQYKNIVSYNTVWTYGEDYVIFNCRFFPILKKTIGEKFACFVLAKEKTVVWLATKNMSNGVDKYYGFREL